MPSSTVRRLLFVFLLLLLPIAWLAMKFDPYQVDGDAVAYMDIADMIRGHQWHGIVNGYWHPLYPACLALGQALLHPAHANELGAYYVVNFLIFLAEAAAMLAFVTALVKLRSRFLTPTTILETGEPLLSLNGLRFLGLGLLVIAVQRELSMGKIRPDALLQALMMGGFAALMSALAAESVSATVVFVPLMGICFGLAYLAKSFAFAVGLLSLLVLIAAGLWLERRTLRWAATVGVLFLVPFFAIAAPYIAALSHKYGHLDFGDSGALNYAWYSGDTEKMHLEPSMTDEFGTATVHLAHPEQQLLTRPGVYSYRAVPNGTYPDWFDPSYFNQGVKPHMRPKPLIKRDTRNAVLVVRYLFNHPEAWVVLLLLLALGARFAFVGPHRFLDGLRRNGFWIPVTLLGLAMWVIYGLVNIEERYVTLAYFAVVLPLFATLRVPESLTATGEAWPRRAASAMVVLLAFLALGESLRMALEERRVQKPGVPTWRSPQIFSAAEALAALGVQPGDEVACMGTTACLYDPYWARLDRVRITTEIYEPDPTHLLAAWEDLPAAERQQALDALRAQGAKVLVAHFSFGEAAPQSAEQDGWRQLGETPYYALPLNLAFPPAPAAPYKQWVGHNAGNQ